MPLYKYDDTRSLKDVAAHKAGAPPPVSEQLRIVGLGASIEGRPSGSPEWRSWAQWNPVDSDSGDGTCVTAVLGPDHKLGSATSGDESICRNVHALNEVAPGVHYEKGHLLSAQLGGPGNDSRNLAAIPSTANKLMHGAEDSLKGIVNQERGWVHFRAQVSHGNDGGHRYASKISCFWVKLMVDRNGKPAHISGTEAVREVTIPSPSALAREADRCRDDQKVLPTESGNNIARAAVARGDIVLTTPAGVARQVERHRTHAAQQGRLQRLLQENFLLRQRLAALQAPGSRDIEEGERQPFGHPQHTQVGHDLGDLGHTAVLEGEGEEEGAEKEKEKEKEFDATSRRDGEKTPAGNDGAGGAAAPRKRRREAQDEQSQERVEPPRKKHSPSTVGAPLETTSADQLPPEVMAMTRALHAMATSGHVTHLKPLEKVCKDLFVVLVGVAQKHLQPRILLWTVQGLCQNDHSSLRAVFTCLSQISAFHPWYERALSSTGGGVSPTQPTPPAAPQLPPPGTAPPLGHGLPGATPMSSGGADFAPSSRTT